MLSGHAPAGDRPREKFAADRPVPVPFDAKRAMGYLEALCKIGPRISGSDGMKKQQELRKELLAEALAGSGLDAGVDIAKLWEATEIVDEHLGDEPVAPVAPRIAVRAAQHDMPAGLVAGWAEEQVEPDRQFPRRGSRPGSGCPAGSGAARACGTRPRRRRAGGRGTCGPSAR